MKVRLVAYTQLHGNISNIISEEELPAYTARISYKSQNVSRDKNIELNKELIRLDHRTPFEAIHYVFFVGDVSKILLGQITRHRIGIGFTAQSGRHVDLSNVEYYKPKFDYVDDTEQVNRIFDNFYQYANDVYKELLAHGVKPQEARYVLPAARLTNFYMYVTAAALRNLFYRRLDRHAEGEINELARKLLEIVYRLHPSIYYDYWQQYKSSDSRKE